MEFKTNSALNTLSESIRFGEELLAEFTKEENLEVEHKVILSLYRKLLEQLDGNFVLADHKLDSASKVMIRAAFETYLALKYILQEKRRIQDRALCYYIGYVKSQQTIAKDILDSPVAGIPQKKMEDTLKETSKILNTPKFKKIVEEWSQTKTASKSKYEPKWYSLFGGPKSLKQLVEKLGDSNDYTFYSLLSQEAHGYQALNGINDIDLVNKPLLLKPIRIQIENASFQEEIARALCTSATYYIIKNIFPENEKKFIAFAKEIGLISKSFPFSYST